MSVLPVEQTRNGGKCGSRCQLSDVENSVDMRIEDLAEQSYGLLSGVLCNVQRSTADGNATAACFRRSFILIQAAYIQQLADDALWLEDQKRTRSSPLIIRGMLESLFILGAAIHKVPFAQEKVVFDFEQAAHYARNDAKNASSAELGKYLLASAGADEKIAANLRKRHKIENKFRWMPSDCALEAGLFRQYAIFYALYSRSTHAELFSTIDSANESTSLHVFRTVALVCLEAVKYVIGIIEVDDKENLEKRRVRLFSQMKKFEGSAGLKGLHIQEMFGKPVIKRGKRASRLQQN